MAPKTINQHLQQKRPLFFSIGLVIALSLVITAFEWKTVKIEPGVDFEDSTATLNPIIDIPITTHDVPPRPMAAIKSPIVDKPVIDLKPDDILSPDDFKDPVGVVIDDLPEPVDEPVDVFEDYAVTQASFVGGQEKFYDYLKTHLKYPSSAIARGVDGKVYLSFIVDEKGNVTNVEVVKGINEAIDNAAIEVLKNSPKWNPASRAGIPVKTRMQIPVVFSFDNS